MTPEELRQRVSAAALSACPIVNGRQADDIADAALAVVREAMREPLQRAKMLLSVVTVGQVMDGGDRFIEAAGLNPWAVNEGRACREDRINPWWLAASPLAEPSP